MTAHEVARLDLDESGVDAGAGLVGDVAAWGEAAARGRLQEVGRVALDRAHHLALLVDVGEGLDELPGVGVLGVSEDVGRSAALDHLAGVHDDPLVAGLGHHREVVADQDERQVELLAQARDELEDLRLHHHVEGRGGLVADHEPGVAGQRHGDHGALAHAAAELVREVHDALAGDADQVVELAHAHHRLLLAQTLVQADRLGDLAARLLHWVEGVHRPLEDDADLLPADLAHAVLGALGEVLARRRAPRRRRCGRSRGVA